jgi:hypothetical protein
VTSDRSAGMTLAVRPEAAARVIPYGRVIPDPVGKGLGCLPTFRRAC